MRRVRWVPVTAAVFALFLAGCGEQGITETGTEGTRVDAGPSSIAVVTETGLSEHDLSGVTGATDFVTAGTGTQSNAAETITVDVPAGATVEQVYLYWGRRLVNPADAPPPDATINVDGSSVSGSIIGGPIETSDNLHSPTVYLADITGEGVVSAGMSSFTVQDGADGALGASVLVFYDDGGDAAAFSLWDGVDFVWANDDALVRQTAEPVTHTFSSATVSRDAELVLFVGDVGDNRPNELEITIGTTTTIIGDDEADPFFNADGAQWDNFVLPLTIPAGVTEVTVEPISPFDEDNPASIVWAATGLSVQPPPPPPGGGEGCTPGFWRQEHHFDSWVGHAPTDLFGSVFDLPSGLEPPEQNANPAELSLLDALVLRGGGVNALMRHAVAALLNAASPDVDYDLTEAEVVQAFNDALTDSTIEATKDELEAFNEQGCPLN